MWGGDVGGYVCGAEPSLVYVGGWGIWWVAMHTHRHIDRQTHTYHTATGRPRPQTAHTHTPTWSCRSITSTHRASGAKKPEAGLPPPTLVVGSLALLLLLLLPGCCGGTERGVRVHAWLWPHSCSCSASVEC